MNLSILKNLFMKIMIGCLIAAGAIAVFTVLSGQFNEVFSRALGTIGLIALHALASFVYIDINERRKANQEMTLFTNAVFVIIILSFITSIFGIWGILGGVLIAKLYLTYAVLLFAVLHGEVLSKTTGNTSTIDNVVYTNYLFMFIVVAMLLPIIYASDTTELGDVYYRLLAAFGIIDATLTLVAIILYKMHLEKHPKADQALYGEVAVTTTAEDGTKVIVKTRKRMNILLVLLFVYIGFQLISGLVVAVVGRKAATNVSQANTTRQEESRANEIRNENVNLPTSNYSYESTFVSKGTPYTCSRLIPGTWKRIAPYDAYQSSQLQEAAFSFSPATISDLGKYCKRLF